MRVLHLVDSSSFNSILADISKHTDPSHVRLTIGSLEPAGEMQQNLSSMQIDTFALDCTRRSQFPQAIIRMTRLLRQRKIDVVHTHLVQSSLVGLASARLAGTRARVMTRHHADAAFLSGSRKALALDRFTGRYLANEIIAVSEATRRAIIEIDKINPAKVSVVSNGFDWTRMNPGPGARAAIREEFGIGEDETLLCNVGRLDPLKGQDVLLRSFADANLPNAWLMIVGDGPRRSYLEQLGRELAIADRVVFTGYRSDVYDLIAAADMMVQPSFSEAQNQTIIEALYLGCPVIATAVGDARDVIIPEATGWLVAPRDQKALTQTLQAALADKERAKRYATAGQDLVRKKFSISKMIEGYEAVYACRLAKA